MLTLQDALLRLAQYWTERGCMIAQPFNTEVGAGTLNPATALRVLGPEPWHVAYVEPSVRPDDARYGENPNRLQMHTQYQVILKPDPGDPQELYLGSLAALGIDLAAHDVRFVEDNWASPALGAWGLGWEVWLDGMEITQFTYFQQTGGLNLDPVSVEITYGIERIMMALQGVDHFTKIAYADGISYGEVFGQSEYEMSRYYLDDADVVMNTDLFERYATEGERLVAERLPVPAYAYMLRCSHTFNVLDSRGSVSTTQRAAAFTRMRRLARNVAELWVERRAELDHPLGVVEPLPPATVAEPSAADGRAAPATLLVEIGVEELPAGEVDRVRGWVRDDVARRLADTRLAHGDVRTWTTPRRIVIEVTEVAAAETDSESTVRGPKAQIAFDADGNPTKAAEGFARKNGVDAAALQRVDEDGTEYVAVTRQQTGRSADAVIAEVVAGSVRALRADRNMRWRDPELSYARAIRWLLVLHGDRPVPVAVSALASGTVTYGLRGADGLAAPVEVTSCGAYMDTLHKLGIVLDGGRRRDVISSGARALADEAGGRIDEQGESALLDEIAAITEAPVLIRGGFEERYLEVPEHILTTVMKKHQRYLPVRDADGRLLPTFVTAANGECDHALVAEGNERVLRARFEDAAFFFAADLTTPIADMQAQLEKLTFAEGLGSMADRARRIAATANRLVGSTGGLDDDVAATVARAGELAKFDLGSQMVVELTSLAGTMAEIYAKRAGESDAVATALREMELPRSAGDRPPQTWAGAFLALADRLDVLVGLFATGARPRGSSDPYGLRRAALGVLAILGSFPLEQHSITDLLGTAAEALREQGVDVPDEAVADAAAFVTGRFLQQLGGEGVDHRIVAAVTGLADHPGEARATADFLRDHGRDDGVRAFAEAMERSRRILGEDRPEPTLAQKDRLVEPAERELAGLLEGNHSYVGSGPTLNVRVEMSADVVAATHRFFDEVMVMTDDADLRQARMELLSCVLVRGVEGIDYAAVTSL